MEKVNINNELISIVVPIFNVEDYLEKCINSIIEQTYRNIEIILVNDGSTDSSLKICERFLEIDSRIILLNKENGGLSSARNYGIKHSKGTLLSFIDSDDQVVPDYIETLYDVMMAFNTDVSIAASTIVRGNKNIDQGLNYKTEKLNTATCISRMLLEQGFTVSACAKLYRRHLFDKIIFPEGKLYEDNAIIFNIIMQCEYIAYSNKSIYKYFIRGNSITTSSFSIKHLDYIEFADSSCEFIERKFPSLRSSCEYRKAFARFNILKKIVLAENRVEFKKEEDKLIKYFRSNFIRLFFNNENSTKLRLSLIMVCINIRLFIIGANIYENNR